MLLNRIVFDILEQAGLPYKNPYLVHVFEVDQVHGKYIVFCLRESQPVQQGKEYTVDVYYIDCGYPSNIRNAEPEFRVTYQLNIKNGTVSGVQGALRAELEYWEKQIGGVNG